MPGVPSARGCEACRRATKKCDLAKPRCAGCVRRDIPCIGNGVKRWKFMSQSPETELEVVTVAQPKRSPSNEVSRMASALVYVLDAEDIRYDIRTFGGQFVMDLPRRIGSSALLDAAIAATLAAYYAVHNKEGRARALSLYGSALETLRAAIADKPTALATKVYSIVLISSCQEWVDSSNKHTGVHRQMIAHLVRDSVKHKELVDIEHGYIYPLCQALVWDAWINPNIRLEEWFWPFLDAVQGPRPHTYKPGLPYKSLDAEIQAETAVYAKDPKRNLHHLRRIYDTTKNDMRQLQIQLIQLILIESLPTSDAEEKKQRLTARVSFQIGYGLMIFLASGINRAIRPFHSNSLMIADMHEMCDEALKMCPSCEKLRPFGSIFVPRVLKVIWACLPNDDTYRRDELETWLYRYGADFEGTDYVWEATMMRDKLDSLPYSVSP